MLHPLVVASLLEVCQGQKTPRLTVHWPVISIPLPRKPGISGQRGLFCTPLPVTPRGNTSILLFGDGFSRCTDVAGVTTSKIYV